MQASALKAHPLAATPPGSSSLLAELAAAREGSPRVSTSSAASLELAPSLQLGSFHRSTSTISWDDLSDTSSDEDLRSVHSCANLELLDQPTFEPLAVDQAQPTELKVLKDAFHKKERECEHLRQIIKELSVSRSRVTRQRTELEEQFSELQAEYYRVLKVSELARTVSQQSVSRASGLRDELRNASDQLRRTRRRAAAAEAKAAALRDENGGLRQRLALFESLALQGAAEPGQPSACAREFLVAQSLSLY